MGGEEDDGHAGGEGEIGGVGLGSGAEEVADGAKDEHTERGEDERDAEEGHGGAGEIEEMAKGEVVVGGVLVEEVKEVGTGGEMGGGEGEEGAEERDEGGEGEEEVAVGFEGGCVGF